MWCATLQVSHSILRVLAAVFHMVILFICRHCLSGVQFVQRRACSGMRVGHAGFTQRRACMWSVWDEVSETAVIAFVGP